MTLLKMMKPLNGGLFAIAAALLLNAHASQAVTVTASSFQSPNTPANTLDNNLNTRWSAQGNGAWIQYDMGATVVVDSVDVAFHNGNSRTSSIVIMVSSNGSSWTTLFTGNSAGNSNAQQRFDLPNTSGRYVRIVGNGNSSGNGWNSLTEVDINTIAATSSTSSNSSSSKSSSSAVSSSVASSSKASSSAPTTGIWKPSPYNNLTWDWQIGAKPNASTVPFRNVYNIDLFDNSAADIATFHSRGMKVICYFSAGTYEGWRPDWAQYFPFITSEKYTGTAKPFLGNMADWDERWLDVREINLLAPIMKGRMAMAKAKGCDGVEPDNMDSYTNTSEVKPSGSYTGAHQIAYNKAIAQWAHEAGLSVGLKNDVDQIKDLVNYFDWALNEQCYQYGECDDYATYFVATGKAVFGVEYSGSASTFCPKANASGYYWLKKTLALTASRTGCENY